MMSCRPEGSVRRSNDSVGDWDRDRVTQTRGGREDTDFVGGTEKYTLIHELNFEEVLL